MLQATGNYGWICPVCGKVYAPFVPNCGCTEKKQSVECTTYSTPRENEKDNYTICKCKDEFWKE